MTEADIFEQLRQLTTRQREVLSLICEGTQYKKVAEILFIEENTVKGHMANIYVKLGLDHLTSSLRRKIIFETYCPALHELDVEPQEGEPIEPEPAPMDIIDMVEEDERALVVVEPDIIEVIPSKQKKKKKRHRNGWKWILALVVIVLLTFGGFKLYEFVADFFESLQIQTSPVQEEEQKPLAQVFPTNTIQIPELTARPTNTEVVPTNTSQPTAPPAPAILFSDDFAMGLSSGWQVVYGNPIVVNGQLTADEDTLLIAGDTEWTDYSVEFLADAADCWFSWSENWISVRSSNIDNMYAYKWSDCESYWYIIQNGSWKEIPQSESKPGYELLNFRINVESGSIAVYVNGVQKASFFDSTFSSGRIGIKIAADTIIDDFAVRELD